LISAVEAAVLSDIKAFREREDMARLSKQLRSLTSREREVMLHMIQGRLNKQIAGDMDIVEKTVKVHRARVMEKMCVRSVADLVHIVERLKRNGCKELLDTDYR
jgi:FixJ family two-component response regulator